jgi:hypothetical protein
MWDIGKIFAATSDQAHLITAAISVVAAVLVVFLTHVLAARRAKGELRAKKLEECFMALSDFRKAASAELHQRAIPNEHAVDVGRSYEHAHNKIEMLTALHVPEIRETVMEMHMMVLLEQSFEDRDTAPFHKNLEKLVRLASSAESQIVKKIRKIV